MDFFLPKIPRRISDHSCTLIDNIFSNNIKLRDTSGILMNIHELIVRPSNVFFIDIENITNIDKVSKYIEVEKSDEISLQNFINKLK